MSGAVSLALTDYSHVNMLGVRMNPSILERSRDRAYQIGASELTRIGVATQARAKISRSARTLYEKRIELQPFWQRSLLHELFNITSKDHAVK